MTRLGTLCMSLLLCSERAVLADYPENYLSEELGATVATSAKLRGSVNPNALRSSGPISVVAAGSGIFNEATLHRR